MLKVTENGSESEEEREWKYRLAREECTRRLEKRLIAVERALEALLRIQEDQKNQSKLSECAH